MSPECSKSDASSDPFSFWESQVNRALDLIIDVRSSAAPVWKTAEIATQIEEFSTAFANYAASAEKTADSWTNFFGKADRPEDKAKVKPYVLAKLKALICNPELMDVIKAKESQDAQKLAEENLEALRAAVVATNKYHAVFTETDLKCN
jgi:deferrochelatase/peroxidase EfeB